MTDEAEGPFTVIKSALSREELGARFRAIGKALRNIPRPAFLHYTTLTIILALAAIIRLLPLRWGAYISEFDPYFNYNDMRQITANGWQFWYHYTDTRAWFPFGRAPVITSYPGTSFTGTLVYQFLNTLGIPISLYDAAVYTPVFLGVFAVLVTYFFARDLWGKSAGLFAALFLAFNSSLISRTDLGFFRNEGVGIPTMVLAFLFYVRAVQPNRSLKATVIYSMLSSVSLIYMAFSWGSFRYAAEVIGLFTFALILIRRYTPRLFLAYGTTIGFFLYTGTQLPLLGHIFLTESTTLALVGIMGVLVIMELAKLAPTSRGRLTVLGFSTVSVAGVAYFLLTSNLIGAGLRGKFLATVNPFIRQNIPLIASVAENRPSTWASFYLELGSLTLLGVFGFFFAFQRLREGDVLLIIFGVTAFYFAASLVRLTLILAPAISTLAAITVVELGKPAMDIIRQSVIFPRRKLRFVKPLSREYSLGILLIVLILVIPTFINAVQSAYTPVTIAASSLPVRAPVDDWFDTLTWMNNNLPSTSVVFAWWDYGYWITVNTGLHTLADNGTGNLTQIQNIAAGFMLNESLAVHLLQRYGVTHVAVFVSYNRGLCGAGQNAPLFCGYGEDSKWFWMVRIGNGTLVPTPLGLGNVTFRQITDPGGQTSTYHRIIKIGKNTVDEAITTNTGGSQLPASNTLLGLLMRNGYPGGMPGSTSDIDRHTPAYFTKAFASRNNYVLVYSVKYPTPTSITVRFPQALIRPGANATITGTLATASGQPITTTAADPVFLEHSEDGGVTWSLIGKTNATSGSLDIFRWPSATLPGGGQNFILVRARWGGDRNQSLDIAVSPAIRLTET